MEGTRNERVAILLTAYFIGFVTAYIAFGVTQLEDKIKYVSAPAIQNAAVIQAQTTNALLTIDSHGLSVVVNGEVRLLSALVDGKTELEMREGEHAAIATYALSPKKDIVYFCEVPYVGSEACLPFIYLIDTETVYPVRIDSERVAFSSENPKDVWDQNGRLTVDALPQ